MNTGKTHLKALLSNPQTRRGIRNRLKDTAELACRVDRALRTAVSCWDRIPKLAGFYRPLAPIGLDDPWDELFSESDDEDIELVNDYLARLWDSPSRSLLSLSWGGMGGGTLGYDVIRLADRTSIYFRSDDVGQFLIASSIKLSNTSTADRIFVEALVRSNGTVFGERMFGGVPTEFCTIANKRILPDLLYPAFEDARRDNNDEIWDELAELIAKYSDRGSDWWRLKRNREGRLYLVRKYVARFVIRSSR